MLYFMNEKKSHLTLFNPFSGKKHVENTKENGNYNYYFHLEMFEARFYSGRSNVFQAIYTYCFYRNSSGTFSFYLSRLLSPIYFLYLIC